MELAATRRKYKFRVYIVFLLWRISLLTLMGFF